MADYINKLLERFQLLRVPSLPPLILQGLNLQDGQQSRQINQEDVLVDLLGMDITLHAKVLGALHFQQSAPPIAPRDLIRTIGAEKIQALISQTAIQLSFNPLSQQRSNFFYQQWRDSCLTAMFARALARELDQGDADAAAFCARFLNIGELVLENLYGSQYLKLQEKVKSPMHLYQLEKDKIGSDHAEIGAELLARWGFDTFICDAIRYHHEEPLEMQDATTLVKICWLANALCDDEDIPEETLIAGQQLLGLGRHRINDLSLKVRADLDKRLDSLDITFRSMHRFPLQSAPQVFVESELMKEVKHQAENISLFNSFSPRLFSQSGGELTGQLLRDSLGLLFGIQNGIFFTVQNNAGKPTLVAHTKTSETGTHGNLTINTDKSRSLVSLCLKEAELKQAGTRNEDLAVIDRQLLSMLGTPWMACDPVFLNNRVIGVLVVGMSKGIMEYYCNQPRIRSLLKKALAETVSIVPEQDEPGNEAFYEQKIREAVHEANNPLSIIKNYIQLLSLKQKGSDEIREELGIIRSEIDRVSSILTGLRKNAVADEDKAGMVGVNDVIANLNKVFMASLFSDKSIKVNLRLQDKLPPLYCRENALIQILTNLLKNAAEALPINGTIEIKTGVLVDMQNVRRIQISVCDDGPGLPDPIRDTLFQPGNTTKGGSHSGSGLAIIKRLTEELNGFMTCQTGSGGTCFELQFPITDQADIPGDSRGLNG